MATPTRLRQRRASDRAALPHPQGRRPCDRGARRARALRRRRGFAHGLGRHPDAAQGQARHRRRAGLCRKPGARDRAPCRRRLRAEEPVLSGRAGGAGGGLCCSARRSNGSRTAARASPPTNHEREQDWDLEAAVDADGRLLAVRGQRPSRPRLGDAVGPVDAAELRRPTSSAPMCCRRCSIDFCGCLTNLAPATSSRGAGRPQGTFAMERLLDRIAEQLWRSRATRCAAAI